MFRLEDGKKIADYKSTAKVRCMKCTQDSKSVVIGCEDGSVSMFIIADPFYPEYFNYLAQWRANQMEKLSREGFFFLNIIVVIKNNLYTKILFYFKLLLLSLRALNILHQISQLFLDVLMY